MKTLLLASGSPRRKELLQALYTDFIVWPSACEEQRGLCEGAHAYVKRLAREKAQASLQAFQKQQGEQTAKEPQSEQQLWSLGSDTLLFLEPELKNKSKGEGEHGRILEKPQDFDDFKNMMMAIGGRAHQVLTAVALTDGKQCFETLVSTQVFFRALTAQEIQAYWQTGEPQDKAGGYAIQGQAARFVERIEGSYTGVIGLPLYETEVLLKQAGLLE